MGTFYVFDHCCSLVNHRRGIYSGMCSETVAAALYHLQSYFDRTAWSCRLKPEKDGSRTERKVDQKKEFGTSSVDKKLLLRQLTQKHYLRQLKQKVQQEQIPEE